MADASFLVDSDVLIDFLRGDSRAADWLSAHEKDVVGIPVVVLMELLQGARSAAEQSQIQQGLSSLSVQHLETGNTQRALEWFATYRLSHGTGIMDCLIASVARPVSACRSTPSTTGTSPRSRGYERFNPMHGAQPPLARQGQKVESRTTGDTVAHLFSPC